MSGYLARGEREDVEDNFRFHLDSYISMDSPSKAELAVRTDTKLVQGSFHMQIPAQWAVVIR